MDKILIAVIAALIISVITYDLFKVGLFSFGSLVSLIIVILVAWLISKFL